MFSFFASVNKNSGMTFIELVVVMGIFTAISSTVLFNYRDFSDGVALQNLAQEIALQGKRAQTLASQGRSPVTLFSDAQLLNSDESFLPADFVASYGIAFRPEVNPRTMIFYFNSFPSDEENPDFRKLYFKDFIDSNYSLGDCESVQDSECLEEINITDGSYIELICLGSEPRTDPNCDLGTDSEELYVSFTRPFLEAYILSDNIPDTEDTEAVSNAFVKVSSRSGDQNQKRYIEFWSTGQISVY